MQPRWMWWPGTGPIKQAIKQAIMQTFTVLGFASLVVGLACRDWRYLYVAAASILPMLPYIFGQPIGRYRYPVSGLLVFLAADMISRAAKFMSNRPSLPLPVPAGAARPNPRPITSSPSTKASITRTGPSAVT
jgi:hypothetical protein